MRPKGVAIRAKKGVGGEGEFGEGEGGRETWMRREEGERRSGVKAKCARCPGRW